MFAYSAALYRKRQVLLGSELHAAVIGAVLGVLARGLDAARPEALSGVTAVPGFCPLAVPHLVLVFLLRFVFTRLILLFLTKHNKEHMIENNKKPLACRKKIMVFFLF